jgi:tetratricopeptide (TPR) repeat protein
MMSKVLWALDSEIEAQAFERLCVDLLYRNGFKDIDPVEPQDGGRDAEEHPRRGRGCEGEGAFFQFSKEEDWKGKLRSDAKKLAEGGFTFQRFVFVTPQKARGVDRDALAQEIREKYGWKLTVFSRAWFRLQLEEAQPDLAKKYLDVDVAADSPPAMRIARLEAPAGERFVGAWLFFEAGKFERAAVAIKEVLDVHPEPDRNAYQALAWCEYRIRRYDEALSSINRALALKNSNQGRAIRACILVEKGIATRDRVSLVEGRKLFEQLVAERVTPLWCQLFSLGNAQAALGEQHAAIASYLDVLKEQPDQIETLKNLGSVYHRIGDHVKEIECFDRALEIDPLKWEALVSEGVSLIVDFDQPADAADLLEQALKWHPGPAVHWPHVWYWLGEARRRAGNDAGALTALDQGLAHQPGHRAMWRLKSDILNALADTDPERAAEAAAFWRERLDVAPSDYGTRKRLLRLLQQGNEDAAWAGLDDHLKAAGLQTAASLRDAGFSLDQCITALRFTGQYLAFRSGFPVSGYWVEDDPLYDLGFAAPAVGKIQDAFTLFMLVPFGLGFSALEASKNEADAVKRLQAAFGPLRVNLTQAISRASSELAPFVPTAPGARTEAADRLTEVLMFMGLVALREFGRQRGWIASQFPISNADLNAAIDDCDEGQIERDAVVESLRRLNDALELFPQ